MANAVGVHVSRVAGGMAENNQKCLVSLLEEVDGHHGKEEVEGHCGKEVEEHHRKEEVEEHRGKEVVDGHRGKGSQH